MAEHNPIDNDHEDGSWFLEAVGVKKPAPTSIESIAELERENAQSPVPDPMDDDPTAEDAAEPEVQGDTSAQDEQTRPPTLESMTPAGVVIEMTSFDGDPGTSLSMFDPVPDLPPLPSNVAIAIPHEPSTSADILSDTLEETTLAAPLQTRRPFRWPAFALVLGVIAAIVLAIIWLPKAADSAAAATRTSYYDASLAVREFLPTAQASLDIVTNASSTDDALDTVIPVVSELSSHATNLASTAAEPLPTRLPLLPSEALDELPPLQDRTAILASDTSEVARQLGHAYVYRTSITNLLLVDDLPATGGTDEINAMSVVLAVLLAENASLVADLPSNTQFDDVASAASDAVAALARWQEEYLDALADGNAEAAESLITELSRVRKDLVSEMNRTLIVFREALDIRMVSLSGEFDQHLTNLSQ